MTNLVLVFLIFAAGCVLYRYRAGVLAALRRFDARNAQRQEDELRERVDPQAHYKRTLQMAAEQFEDISEISEPDPRTGIDLPVYLFLGVRYETREAAETARHRAIVDQAREFYIDLDGRRLDHSGGRRAHENAALPTRNRETLH
jgi:hypothetical protein